MDFSNLNFKKIAIVSGIIVAILLVAGIVKYSLDNYLFQEHGYIKITSAPQPITAKFLDRQISIAKSETQIAIPTGEQTIEFSRDGFAPAEQKVTVKKDEITIVTVILEAETEEARQELDKSKYQSVYEYISGVESVTGAEEIRQKNPNSGKLPIYSATFSITSCPAYRESRVNDGSIGVCISVMDVKDKISMDQALERLKELEITKENTDIRINSSEIPTDQELASGEYVRCNNLVPYCFINAKKRGE